VTFSNTSVEQYYIHDSVRQLDGYYYLNTFDNILASGGKTVLNHWVSLKEIWLWP